LRAGLPVAGLPVARRALRPVVALRLALAGLALTVLALAGLALTVLALTELALPVLALPVLALPVLALTAPLAVPCGLIPLIEERIGGVARVRAVVATLISVIVHTALLIFEAATARSQRLFLMASALYQCP